MNRLFAHLGALILVAILAASGAEAQDSGEPVSHEQAATQIVILEAVDTARGVVTVRGQKYRVPEELWVGSGNELQSAGSTVRQLPRWLSQGTEVGVVIENGELVRIFPWEDEK